LSAKLEQLLGYLDRAEVSEIIVGIGRPIALKMSQGYTPLTSLPVSEAQFVGLLGATPLARVANGTSTQPVDCEVGRRRVRVELIRRGSEGATLRIQAVPAIHERTLAMPTIAMRPPDLAEPSPKPGPLPGPAGPAGPPPVEIDAAAVPPESFSVRIDAPARGAASGVRTEAVRVEPVRVEPEPVEEEELDESAIVDDGSLIDERINVSLIATYVRAARLANASDLHLAADRPVQIRVKGELRPLEPTAPPVPGDIADRVLLSLLGPRRRLQLRTKGYVDLAFDVPNGGRLRGNISRQQGGLRAAFRLARVTPPTLDELNLPAQLAKVVMHHQGLVVIAGPNGQGKTTTLAALVDLVNSTKPHHIITIEDPVELEHPRKMAVISQREVGRHTKSFAAALKGSLREDPDVIVIGELRDRETVEIALTAAETGHLVLATMSTPSAAKTIDRLIDMFPPDEQTQARASIAGALRAVVAQRLLPMARGNDVVPAIEMVTGVLPLAVLIRDDKLYQLPNLMQRGRAFGMIRFEDSVLELLRTGMITEDIARQFSPAAVARPAQPMQTQPLGRVGKRE
jgi:twitching motility protein PilT